MCDYFFDKFSFLAVLFFYLPYHRRLFLEASLACFVEFFFPIIFLSFLQLHIQIGESCDLCAVTFVFPRNCSLYCGVRSVTKFCHVGQSE